MLKKIQLKCTKIKYSGDSVGDDIRIEAEALDKFFGLNMELDPKSERKFDEVIGDFFAEGSFFVLPVNIKVIERDLIFNDVGETKVKLRIDLKKETPQRSVHKIEIHELRNFFSKKKAVFEVTVEALVSDMIGYVKETDDGWLVSVNEGTKENIDLPFSLKVMIDRIESNREFFTILEGSYQGVKASVEIEQEKSRFFFKCPHTDPIQLTYSVSSLKIKHIKQLIILKLHGKKEFMILKSPIIPMAEDIIILNQNTQRVGFSSVTMALVIFILGQDRGAA